VGLEPERFRDADRTDLDAFVELHIEQGRMLYDERLPLGVVSTITGLYRFLVTVEGRTDHAGTTPMDLRRDAFQAAAEMSSALTRLAVAEGRPAVLTTGWWDIQPGAWNIVPGLVKFGVDLRHPDEATKQRLAAEAHALCQGIGKRRAVKASHEVVGDIPPQDMHPAVRAEIEAAAEACDVTYIPMVSGAGHDSQVMATRVPTAMLFVPSHDGRSHSAAELTTPEDAARGATVLATALQRIAY
jgi:allantoate deiminase